MSKCAFSFLLFVYLPIAASFGANDPLVGKWKLNPSKSQLVDQMKVAAAGANKYTFTFAGADSETITTDGTDQPGLSGTTLSVTIQDSHTWKVVRKEGGRTLLTAIWKLSEDGRTLRDAYTENQANGSTLSMDYIYTKTSGAPGFAGTWESTTQQLNSVYELQIHPYEGDGLSFVAEGATKSLKCDGKDYVVQGPNGPLNSLSSCRRPDVRSLEMTDKTKKDVIDAEEFTLSRDGKSLRLILRKVGQSTPNTLIFDRE
jgi:hypothetical protein